MLPFVSSSISKCFHLHTTSYCWVPGLPGSITLRSTRHSDSSPSTFPPPPTHKTPCFGSLLVQGVFAQSPKFREAPQKADSNPPKSLGLFWGRGLLPFVKCVPYTRHYRYIFSMENFMEAMGMLLQTLPSNGKKRFFDSRKHEPQMRSPALK